MGSYFPKIKHWWVPIHITLVYPWTAAEIAFFDDDPEYSDGKMICRLKYGVSFSRKAIPEEADMREAWWKAESIARDKAKFSGLAFDEICIEQERRIKGLRSIS